MKEFKTIIVSCLFVASVIFLIHVCTKWLVLDLSNMLNFDTSEYFIVPNDKVQDIELKVYFKQTNLVDVIGKFEYYIRDGTSEGWKLISDKDFEVGDKILIIKEDK